MFATAHTSVVGLFMADFHNVLRSPESDHRGHKVTIEVTLAIQLPDLSDRLHAGHVADRLAQLGGKVVAWTPESNGTPARARFTFETAAQCRNFLVVALDVPGVSLETPA